MPVPTIIAERLRALQEANGTLHPRAVVDDARDPASPTHNSFEWDDAIAGDKYRLNQASRLIAQVRIEVTYHSVEVSVPAYVSNPSDGGFRSTVQLRSSEDQARAAVIEAMRKVATTARRAKLIAISLELTEYIDQITELANSVMERARATVNDQPAGEA